MIDPSNILSSNGTYIPRLSEITFILLEDVQKAIYQKHNNVCSTVKNDPEKLFSSRDAPPQRVLLIHLSTELINPETGRDLSSTQTTKEPSLSRLLMQRSVYHCARKLSSYYKCFSTQLKGEIYEK